MNRQSSSQQQTSVDGQKVSGIQRFVREPLLHFLLLAALLFVVQAYLGGEEKELIVVDAETQKYLIKQEEDLRLRPLTEDEKLGVIDNFIEEEILVREARARGFTDSSRIRALLLQNMRFFIGGDVPEPTEEDLRAHFEANLAEFTSPQSIDLNHIMFRDPKTVPTGILEKLNDAEDPSKFGDLDMQLGFNLRFLDQRRLVGLFGPETATELLAIEEGDMSWRGPIEAPGGSQHFLRVSTHNPPRTPEFESAKDWIATRWLSTKSRALVDESVEEMRKNYLIDVQPIESAENG
ncbi:peptidyl-prolyl cis-trans isomerase [Labrenzia sp. PHM005]|uniref:peptidylprolyl isomerase n=1 Tax=Labrenzia sp. PHM005 TaxID=2590016 RepID=UPI0011402C88|nr:peptidylprolyl isomerase [Labrenzia sp. PHM005]QDG77701.1 peptidyl-prolyl cis-trans isomerase [Labrenzia sp. PHM005]